jgi:transcriptional regulator with XRE-family HTH domain
VNETPAIRRRLLGKALRRYRETMGFSLEDAALVLECDRSKISRIETGQRGIRGRDLRDLLSEYGIGEREQALLATIADPRRASGWWQHYEDILPADQRDMMIMESLATQALIYHTQQIPGLLQTGDYARAVAMTAPVPPAPVPPATLPSATVPPAPVAARRAADATLARQEAILCAKEPELTVVITEGALRQQVGGPGIMRAQLARLDDLSGTSPRLTIQVLPFSAGAHPGLDVGGLTILTFAETPDFGIVHIPGVRGGIYLEDRDDVSCHISAFAQIREAALSPAASAGLLRHLAVSTASGIGSPPSIEPLSACW